MGTRWLLVALLAGCADDPPAPAPGGGDDPGEAPAAAPALEPLDGPRLLRRVSLDLLGRMPEPAELDAVEADPELWRTIAASYFEDPAFEDRLVHLLAERWWTRVDVFDVVYQDYGLWPEEEFTFERSVGEEPLRLVARVVRDDRPWTDVVLADHTMANEFLAGIWPIAYPDGAEGWQEAAYTDGRPPVGVLATNGLWWRYTTTDSNMNRGRAAAISRLLLCEDYLSRPISLTGASIDAADPEEAIRNDPYCVTCHSSLDPVAASLFGFWWLSLYSRIEEDRYHPEREAMAEEMIGTAPAWYGEPMGGLADLGYQVATDSRFYSCAVESFAELLWRRPVTLDDQPTLEALRVRFLQAEARPQALLMALLETPQYQAGGVLEGAEPAVDERERTARMLSPDQLDASLAALSGFRWQYRGFAQLMNDDEGYRVLAGGVDGDMVTEPQTRPGLPWAVVTRRVAQAAADAAVTYELIEGTGGPVFDGVSFSTRPGDAAFTATLESMWWRLTATRLPDEERAALEALWLAVYEAEGSDPDAAWRSTLSVLFRDPLFLSY